MAIRDKLPPKKVKMVSGSHEVPTDLKKTVDKIRKLEGRTFNSIIVAGLISYVEETPKKIRDKC